MRRSPLGISGTGLMGVLLREPESAFDKPIRALKKPRLLEEVFGLSSNGALKDDVDIYDAGIAVSRR